MNPNGTQKNLKKPFSKENQPKGKRGRKPSSIKKYIKENNMNYNDMIAMVKYVMPMNQSEMNILLMDESVPILIRVFVKSILTDLRNGNLSNVMTLFDRAFGRPTQIQEVTHAVDDDIYVELKRLYGDSGN